MQFAFDLISDLHVESWNNFDWVGQATSPFCVVAGDVARDPSVLKETLQHLSQCYQSIFYIDGNDEHRWAIDDIGNNYRQIESMMLDLPNVVYIHDNVAVINGVAILGTNGWWSWDFDRSIAKSDTQTWFLDYTKCSPLVPDTISALAAADAEYLYRSVAKLQTHLDVKQIVVVSHTVPHDRFVNHDLDLIGTYRYNCLGNSLLQKALQADSEKKISHWCFGHYHGDIDCVVDGIRYVNNCRGRGDTVWKKSVYYPKRIELTI